MEEIRYELKNPFTYHYKGEEKEAQFITLNAPTMKHMKHREPLKQAFYQAVLDLQNNTTDDKPQTKSDETMKGEDILMLLRASQKVNTFQLGLHFVQLLISKGIALIDGSEPVTQKVVDDLDPEDFDNLMGDYLANFIAASS